MRFQSLCSLTAASLVAGVLACGEVSFPILTGDTFDATLEGSKESPVVVTGASGTAVIAVFEDSILSYRIDVASIDSTTLSHIHDGAAGVNGPVVVTLFTGPTACKQNSGAAIAITSSSVGSPTTITTTAPHAIGANGTTTLVRIAGHTGSTPSLDNEYTATVTGTSTFTIPVAVTVAGTGGTAQRFTLINVASPRCRVGYTGVLAQAQIKASAMSQLPTTWGATQAARFDSLKVLMRAGLTYVNVHNRANPGGHVRGQTDLRP